MNKLKLWDNLKTFINTQAVAVDGHPDGRLVDKSIPTYGIGKIKQCPNGRNTLCADIELDENAPERSGYSIGYEFAEIEESGVYNGQPYDRIQRIVGIDHIALTDYNRHPFAIKVEGDCGEAFLLPKLHQSVQQIPSNSPVVKYGFSFDSYKSFVEADSMPQDQNTPFTPTGKFEDTSKNLTTQTPPPRAEINKKSSKTKKKPEEIEEDEEDEELEDKEEEKITGDGNMPNELEKIRIKNAELVRKIATMEATKTANDSNADEILKLKKDNIDKEKELKIAKDSNATYKAELAKIALAKSQKSMKSLQTLAIERGMDSKKFDALFDGATAGKIEFVSQWQIALDSLPNAHNVVIETPSEAGTPPKKKGQDAYANMTYSTADLTYNREKRVMEYKKPV